MRFDRDGVLRTPNSGTSQLEPQDFSRASYRIDRLNELMNIIVELA
jgi:hypothetical protein